MFVPPGEPVRETRERLQDFVDTRGEVSGEMDQVST